MHLRLASVTGVVLAAVSGCGEAERDQPNPDPESTPAAWERLPDPPLSPRTSPVVAWTGTELLVIGGDTSAPCPPNADCVCPDHYARDGAAYRLDTNAWRTIAPAELTTGENVFAIGRSAPPRLRH